MFQGEAMGRKQRISWLRLFDIEHHEVLAGTAASMAPGCDTPQALAAAKASPEYWARKAAA